MTVKEKENVIIDAPVEKELCRVLQNRFSKEIEEHFCKEFLYPCMHDVNGLEVTLIIETIMERRGFRPLELPPESISPQYLYSAIPFTIFGLDEIEVESYKEIFTLHTVVGAIMELDDLEIPNFSIQENAVESDTKSEQLKRTVDLLYYNAINPLFDKYHEEEQMAFDRIMIEQV